jgi:hypothetical protein
MESNVNINTLTSGNSNGSLRMDVWVEFVGQTANTCRTGNADGTIKCSQS